MAEKGETNKRLRNTKFRLCIKKYIPMYVVLLQDNSYMNDFMDKINVILKEQYKDMPSEAICIIIKYNSNYIKHEIYACEYSMDSSFTFLCKCQDKHSCFFDSINYMFNTVIKRYSQKDTILFGVRMKASHIYILAVGNAIDTCSITSSYEATEYIRQIREKKDVTFKYLITDRNNIQEILNLGIREVAII